MRFSQTVRPYARLVVIEGPDGAGKTTLAAEIARRHGHEVRHEGPPPPNQDPLLYYFGRLYDAHLATFATRGQVLDRFALGERVYGPILRNQDRLGAEGWRRIRRALDSIDAVRILCLPDYETCLEQWRARNADRLELIRREMTFKATYDAWVLYRDDPGQLVYDYTDPFTAEAVLDVVAGDKAAAA